MKSLHRFAFFAALLTAAAATSLWARSPSVDAGRLATPQTQSITAEDHMKLASHFLAEAEALNQEARSHEAMASRYDLPGKIASVKSGMTLHCINLARSLKEASRQARELAENHKAMAEDANKPAALAAAPLWASPQRLAAEDLAALQMKGASAEDHRKLAAHFRAEAEAFEQEAESHQAMANRYNLPAKVAAVKTGMALHCVNLSRTLRDAAKEASELAQAHEAMAEQAAR
jgi:hypothetical protein